MANFCFADIVASDTNLDPLAGRSVEAVKTAIASGLHLHPRWHQLLHFNPEFSKTSVDKGGGESAAYGRSDILSEAFFIAKPSGVHDEKTQDRNENIDPKKELEATIFAFFEPVTVEENKHAICKFPARFLWLKNSIDLHHLSFQKAKCTEYLEWSFFGELDSLSVVFATGYFGNPASYYGHMLLKLNTGDMAYQNDLLDISINYGAAVPENEDIVSYIAKGLFGGYRSTFSHKKYHYHTHNYGENEFRDMWEYQLFLSQAEVDLIVAHAWELLGKEYQYYFLSENCAYRIAELLELAKGIELVSDQPGLMFPDSVVKRINMQRRGGSPFVTQRQYLPSRQSRFFAKYHALDSEQQQVIQEVGRDYAVINDLALYEEADFLDRQRMLDTLLDYYQVYTSDDDAIQAKRDEQYRHALVARYRLPVGAPNNFVASPAEGPELGRDPSYIQLGFFADSQVEQGVRLTYRPAYYDSLDGSSAHVKNSTLTMMNLELNVAKGHAQLESLEFINVENIKLLSTGLPLDTNQSWRLKAGIERRFNKKQESDALVYLNGAIGQAWRIGGGSVFFGGLIGATVLEGGLGFEHLLLTPEVFAQSTFASNAAVRVNLQNDYIAANEFQALTRFEFEYRYPLGVNQDIRLSYRHDVNEAFVLSVGFYF